MDLEQMSWEELRTLYNTLADTSYDRRHDRIAKSTKRSKAWMADRVRYVQESVRHQEDIETSPGYAQSYAAGYRYGYDHPYAFSPRAIWRRKEAGECWEGVFVGFEDGHFDQAQQKKERA